MSWFLKDKRSHPAGRPNWLVSSPATVCYYYFARSVIPMLGSHDARKPRILGLVEDTMKARQDEKK
eukprot:scaffold52959_cov20-Prasinocladus_malaysianus.AAC.1